MLFDIAPQDDPGSAPKAKGRKKRPPAPPEPPPTQASCGLPAILSRPPIILGRLDDIVECHRCGASCMDIVEEDGREWMIECCFCGLKQWHPSIQGHLKPKEKGFVFADGRFAGSTVEEAFATPRGREYVEWAAREHKRPSVRDACSKFLLTEAASVR